MAGKKRTSPSSFNALPTDLLQNDLVLANGVRYPLVGGTRQRHFTGTNSKPRRLPENAQTPTSRVHAVLGGFDEYTIFVFTLAFLFILKPFWGPIN